MSKYKVTVSSEAIEDLRDIHSYIAFTLQAKQTATNQLNRIRKAIYELDTFPLRYKLVEWEPWSSMNVHQFSVNNYEIFYTVDEKVKTVSVIHVFYGGRNIEGIIQNDTDESVADMFGSGSVLS